MPGQPPSDPRHAGREFKFTQAPGRAAPPPPLAVTHRPRVSVGDGFDRRHVASIREPTRKRRRTESGAEDQDPIPYTADSQLVPMIRPAPHPFGVAAGYDHAIRSATGTDFRLQIADPPSASMEVTLDLAGNGQQPHTDSLHSTFAKMNLTPVTFTAVPDEHVDKTLKRYCLLQTVANRCSELDVLRIQLELLSCQKARHFGIDLRRFNNDLKRYGKKHPAKLFAFYCRIGSTAGAREAALDWILNTSLASPESSPELVALSSDTSQLLYVTPAEVKAFAQFARDCRVKAATLIEEHPDGSGRLRVWWLGHLMAASFKFFNCKHGITKENPWKDSDYVSAGLPSKKYPSLWFPGFLRVVMQHLSKCPSMVQFAEPLFVLTHLMPVAVSCTRCKNASLEDLGTFMELLADELRAALEKVPFSYPSPTASMGY